LCALRERRAFFVAIPRNHLEAIDMDPLRPVDPDEEFSQEAAEQSDASHSDVETPADIQSASAQELPPVDGKDEMTNDPLRVESDSVTLPPVIESSPTVAGPTSSDPSPMALPDGAVFESPAAFLDPTPAPAEADLGLDAEPMQPIEPVDTAPLADILSPAFGSEGASADPIVSEDSWSDSDASHSTIVAPAAQLSSDVADSRLPAAIAPVDSIADYVRPLADPFVSRKGKVDRGGQPGCDEVDEAKQDRSDSQREPAPVERNGDAKFRATLEALLEQFKDDGSRTRSLLSPTADGGPPMARPIVFVSLSQEQLQAITNDALAESGARLAKAAAEIAEDKVNEALWLRDCEMRDLLRGR
jgi:hypothetical protein